jgi:hypothetical protein
MIIATKKLIAVLYINNSGRGFKKLEFGKYKFSNNQLNIKAQD